MKKMQMIRKELERIRKTHGNILRPEDVVEAAENEKSPLHAFFAWEEAKAAHEYRLWQARKLIANVTVEIRGEKTNEYWNATVTVRNEKTQGYFTTKDVLSNEALYHQVLEEALSDLRYWQKKYKQIKELKNVINEEEIKKIS